MLIKTVRWIWKWIVRLTVLAISIVATIYLVRAFDSRRLPDLKLWHTVKLVNEFRADDFADDFDLNDYLALEERLFTELEERVVDKIEPSVHRFFNRYDRESPTYVGLSPDVWNRTQEIVVDEPVAGIVLLHGCTDSPYSSRAVAEVFRQQGVHVLALRLPGHGTIPGEIRHASWQDWLAVTRMGVRHVRSVVGEDKPVYIGGYSTGGALALEYATDVIDDPDLEPVDRLFLFSPAVGITEFAVVATWHRLLSGIPYFRKFEWNSITAEFDSYKYNSFPKMAGHQVFALAQEVQARLNSLEQRGLMGELPPMIAFHSVVDSTVLTPPLIERVFNKLVDGDSRLVLFDVNRWGPLDQLLRVRHEPLLESLLARNDLGYSFTLVTNIDEYSLDVIARTRKPNDSGETGERLGTTWHRGVFSLSHVAIPFSPDDPLYGADPAPESLGLGAMTPRGERGVLTMSIDQLMRLRFNPFFDYMAAQIVTFCPACTDYQAPPEVK